LSGARVLVVEDDASLRELLRVHLVNAGCEVVLAEDAVTAGPVLVGRHAAIDLAIVDAQLPYLGGLELVATMMADTSVPAIPFIVITGHQDLLAKAERLGVPCLLKPFSTDDLLQLVRLALAPSATASLRVGQKKVANAG
jgi:DNA-binding response OmpR family regulator